ncbi:MAG TPA: carboxypeptidase regulatory-like domain-containing protein [Candidatus Coatesbacteria bacterium]|nr:carboxypeptidase regulatory-like domain-containing protein [Candidatus Coatesbacteria bacterium]
MRIAAIIFCSLFLLAGCKDETGTLTGVVTDDYGEPVAGAVILLDGTDHEATTDAEGRFTIAGIEPGAYTVTGHASGHDIEPLHNVAVVGGETLELELAAYNRDYPVRKPNIYLYPPEATEVTVRLNFPQGGGVTVSEPEYLDGWKVEASPDGILFNYEYLTRDVPGNPAALMYTVEPVPMSYPYLFYEADVPAEWQREYGWLVEGPDLSDFFAGNLATYGFEGREITDFLDYWIPRLNAGFYAVFPQLAADIEPLIGLDVHPEPDSLLRLYYYLVPDPLMGGELAPPEILHFEHEGFTVVEWGVCLEDGLR